MQDEPLVLCYEPSVIQYYLAAIAWVVSVLVVAHWILGGEEPTDE